MVKMSRTTKKQLNYKVQNVNDTLNRILGNDNLKVNVAGRYGYQCIELRDGAETIVSGLTKTQAYECLKVAGRLLGLVERSLNPDDS